MAIRMYCFTVVELSIFFPLSKYRMGDGGGILMLCRGKLGCCAPGWKKATRSPTRVAARVEWEKGEKGGKWEGLRGWFFSGGCVAMLLGARRWGGHFFLPGFPMHRAVESCLAGG